MDWLGIVASVIAAVWVVCGALAYVVTVSTLRRKFPRAAVVLMPKWRRIGLAQAARGPFGLVGSLIGRALLAGFEEASNED